MKTCTKCGQSKALSEFYNVAANKDGKNTACKPCVDEATYKWRGKNRDRWLAKNAENARHKLYREGYGITPAEYEEMLRAQDGKCAICGESETSISRNGRPKTLAVDHNHETGQVRKLLCHLCNTGLGSFRDNKERLRAAIDYLESHEDSVC